MPAGSQRFFHWWAALLLLTSLAVGSLMVFTFGAVSFAAIFILWLREGRTRPRCGLDRIQGIILGLSTLWFRFAFFDVFIKRGTYFFLLLLFLLAYFAFVNPLLDRSEIGGLKPWVLALTLSPLLLLLPWAYGRMALWMDRFWLGRRFSTVEAVKYFLSGAQEAMDEPGLVLQAEQKLAAVFFADVKISLGTAAGEEAGTFEAVHEVPIRERSETVGWIRMGRRLNDAPYFSEDLALLNSLADVFSSLLENVRLQQRKREQQRNEQELRLAASRSELKALRAQINPHFLFNALNAIAGLIQKEPARAEETVEALAEVFRYTLKRSEKELVRLEAELDFVRAYLDVEKARFGDHLLVQLDVDDDAKGEMIPTMAIQTLVENAVKHGVAAIRGIGIVEIRAKRQGDRLCLEVLDNGPGPVSAPPADEPSRDGSGYGLRNLASRLKAHYGPLGLLSIRRDPADKITVASLSLPISEAKPS